MTGPNGVRDRSGTSDGSGRAGRRRRGDAAESQTDAMEGLRQVKRFLWQRKYTLIYLLVLILLSFAVRSVWYYPAAYTGGPTPLLSGNDPDYHKRTVDYFLENKRFLMHDPLLNYPGGGPNPNPPAYSTSIALIGLAISPFYGSVHDAAWFSMEIGACLWAALTVIPVYLFTKEMFGRKSAYLAALFIAFMAGNVERTPLGFSDHDAFFMFFVVTGFFFMLKSLRLVKTRVYVRSWKEPRDITIGLTEFGRTNQVALLYAGMAGFTLAAVALSWKGFPYALAIIFVYLVFHLLVNKFRRIDNTAIALTVLTTVSILMLVSLPYYMTMNFMNWYEAPAILFAATCLVVAIFLFTRDLPWLLVLPVILLVLVVALSVVWYLLPDVWVNIFSGAGYFIRTKLYGTIAEAQPPDFNRLVFAYGMTTFFLALIGVVLMIKDLPKGWKNDHIFTTIWALVSIYMAVAAIRFMYNATPVFAILAGWVTWAVIARLDYRRMVRVFRSMKGDFIKAFKYSVKLRHVGGALFLTVLILAPNLWYSVDAGIPYEGKKEADLDIYNFMPGFMRPSADLYDPTSNNLWYLGSFGTSFMSDYWAQGMWWLAQQDTWLPEEQRPAFISWWDYGHWCVQVGKHPTAADNFQNGVEFAGNFIGAQGEDSANALMLVRLFQLNRWNDTVVEYMRGQIGSGATDELLDLFERPATYTHLIAEYPERYGLKDDDISARNTVFIVGTYTMEQHTSTSQRVDMLLWYWNTVGDSFRYFAVDSRLMPTSYQNTGIFYAPITLSDSRVEDYIEIVAIYNGNQITLQQAAQLPAAERANLQYQLVWKRPFYESMFYRCFIGYSGYDQGPGFSDTGIPYLTGDLARYPPQYAWNQTNWAVVSNTINWNPYDAANISKHQQDWTTVSYEEALRLKAEEEGVLDDAIRSISQGVVYIKWYAGAWVNGTVTTESGKPLPGATVTVHDGFRFLSEYMGPDYLGVPHGTTTTDENGSYSILAPFGNVTVVASNGGNMDYLTLHERNVLNRTNLFISDDAAMRIGEYNFTADMTVPTAYQSGILYVDINGNDQYEKGTDELMANATMVVEGQGGLNISLNLTTYANGFYEMKDALPGDYQVSVLYQDHEIDNLGLLQLSPNQKRVEDLAVKIAEVKGNIVRRDGGDVEGTEVTIRYLKTNETITEEASSTGAYSIKDLLPGNYSLEIYVPGTQPVNESVTLIRGVVETLNYTLVPIAFVEGTVFEDGNGNGHPDPGEGLVNATITYTKIGSAGTVLTTVTNGTGHYNTSVPKGLWSTYIGINRDGARYGYVSQIEVDPADWSYMKDLEVTTAYRINGTVMRAASDTNETLIKAGRTTIEIWNGTSRINIMANATGVFSIFLPEGNYSLFVNKALEGRPRIALDHLNVSGDTDLDQVVLTNGTRLEGSVYFDMNNNSAVNPDETVAGADIVLWAEGHRFNMTTATNGSYSMVAAPLYYNASIDTPAYGPYEDFINATRNVVPTKKNFPLQPYNVSYEGIAGYDWNGDGNLSGDGLGGLVISFVASTPSSNPNAVSVNVTTGPKGRYSVELAPGKYNLKVLLDREEDTGTFRFKYEEELTVKPSTETTTKNIWLSRQVRFNGTLVLSNSDTNVYTNIRVDKGTERVDVNAGEFDSYLTVGEHLLTATYFTTTNGTTDTRYELEVKHDFDRAVTLNLTMYPVVDLKGTVYYDWNGNGQYDVGSDDDKEEAVHIPQFVLRGVSDHDVYPFVNGTFSTSVAPYDNYTILIQRSEFDQGAGEDYQWFKNMTVDLSTDTTMDISLDRQIMLSGRVYWDRNNDDDLVPDEGIQDVVVHMAAVDGSADYSVNTTSKGHYEQYVLVDIDDNKTYNVTISKPGFEPVEPFWLHTINFTNMSLEMEVEPLNVTFNGTTFLDLNGNGIMNWYETAVPVEHIEIWNTINVSLHHLLSTDENGTFQVTVEPGEYDVYAWTEIDGGYLVHLGVHTVEPIGGVQGIDLPMHTGLRASGIMYYHNYTGVNHTVSQVNLTFVPKDGKGEVPILPASSGSFAAVLPEGRYDVNGSFENAEFGVDTEYTLDDDFRMVLRDRGDLEFNFTRTRTWKLDLWWDDLPIDIDVNSSYNLTVYAKNVGSENGTFDIGADVVPQWSWIAGVTNITLNMSQTTSFWFQINSSEKALSGPNDATILATPRNSTDDPSELKIVVRVNQFYGFKLEGPEAQTGFYRYEEHPEEADQRRMTYFFVAENTGNGNETLILTHTNVPNWTIEIPQKEMRLNPYERQPSVPVEVTLPERSELRPQVITITATSKNNPATTPKTLELTLSLPGPVIYPDEIEGDPKGENVYAPKDEAPGFGTLASLAAVGATTLVMANRRRRWSS